MFLKWIGNRTKNKIKCNKIKFISEYELIIEFNKFNHFNLTFDTCSPRTCTVDERKENAFDETSAKCAVTYMRK